MRRADYAFPFRIDNASREGARAAGYEAHVAEMVRQVLLTSPGERVNLPEFGCGLRRLLFAAGGEGTAATTQILVRQALGRWLEGIVEVLGVEAVADADQGRLEVRVEYAVVETRAARALKVTVP
jgi:phage baseplate assembly protein W